MWPNSQKAPDLVTLTEEILTAKLHFFVQCITQKTGEMDPVHPHDNSEWNCFVRVNLQNVNYCIFPSCPRGFQHLPPSSCSKREYKKGIGPQLVVDPCCSNVSQAPFKCNNFFFTIIWFFFIAYDPFTTSHCTNNKVFSQRYL